MSDSPGRLMAASSLLFLAMVFGAHWAFGASFDELLRDPATTTDKPFYLGLVSHAGILVWAATAAVCLFTASLPPHRLFDHSLRSYLRASGMLTLLFTLDDLFLLHEDALPRYFGLPEPVILACYARARTLVPGLVPRHH